MLLQDLFEKVNLSHPGSNRVIDIRAEKMENSKTHVTLTRDGGAIIWNYAEGNRYDWRGEGGVYEMISKEGDRTIQPDPMFGIRFTPKGVKIAMSRDVGQWTGDLNRYSTDIKPIVDRLLDLRIITSRTPIYIGNTARRNEDGELVGSASNLMRRATTPNTLMLLHGTSNARAMEILKVGLSPLDKEARVFNKDKNSPEHREDSVYLTASMAQAEYYAKKAVKIDRARFTWDYRNGINSKANNAKTPEQSASFRYTYDMLNRLSDTVGKVTPVVLGIALARADYKHLMADDDYLDLMVRKGEEAKETDWRASLSQFGQIAYRGTIDPSKISVVKGSPTPWGDPSR